MRTGSSPFARFTKVGQRVIPPFWNITFGTGRLEWWDRAHLSFTLIARYASRARSLFLVVALGKTVVGSVELWMTLRPGSWGPAARYTHLSRLAIFFRNGPISDFREGIASGSTMMQDASCHGPFPHTSGRQARQSELAVYIY